MIIRTDSKKRGKTFIDITITISIYDKVGMINDYLICSWGRKIKPLEIFPKLLHITIVLIYVYSDLQA